MGKRVYLSDEQSYVLAQMVQDQLNRKLLSGDWVYAKFGKTQLKILLEKLNSSKGEEE